MAIGAAFEWVENGVTKGLSWIAPRRQMWSCHDIF